MHSFTKRGQRKRVVCIGEPSFQSEKARTFVAARHILLHCNRLRTRQLRDYRYT